MVETIKDTNKRPFSQVLATHVSNVDSDDADPPLARDNRQGGHGREQRGRGRGYQGGRGCGRAGRGRGYQGNRPPGAPSTEVITTRWYQGHELACMTDEQRQQMRDLCDGRQVGAVNTANHAGYYYPPPPPPGPNPYAHPYPPPPPPSMGPPLLPPPPQHHVGAVHGSYGNQGHSPLNRFGDGGPRPQGFARRPPRF